MNFETMLAGGHPNSLGRTVEVVAFVLADPAGEAGRMEALFACYRSADPVVRLRTSNAMKRVARAQADPALRDWLAPHLDRLAADPRRAVAGKARKLRAALYGT